MNILFTCAGRRHYLIDYFQKAKPIGSTIVGADMQLSAPAMVLVDKQYLVPSVYAPNYVEDLLCICIKENIGAIISLNDLELPILSAQRERFEKLGIYVIVSSKEVIDICFDKWKTHEFANEIGIETPKTYLNLQSALIAINDGSLTFPVVIKPRWGSASIGIEFPENLEELKMANKLLEKKLFRSILSEISKTDVTNAILIQEQIKGKEYGLDVLNNFEGKNISVYVKEKIAMRAGETDKAVLRDHEGLEQLGKKIGENLKHIASLDCDVFEREGRYFLLEMNPRFGGGYPFSQMSGANFPAIIYALLKNEPIKEEWLTKKFNQVFAKFDSLIRVKMDV